MAAFWTIAIDALGTPVVASAVRAIVSIFSRKAGGAAGCACALRRNKNKQPGRVSNARPRAMIFIAHSSEPATVYGLCVTMLRLTELQSSNEKSAAGN